MWKSMRLTLEALLLHGDRIVSSGQGVERVDAHLGRVLRLADPCRFIADSDAGTRKSCALGVTYSSCNGGGAGFGDG